MDLTEEPNKPDAEQLVQRLRERERCKWCGEGDKPLDREQMCAACTRTLRYASRVRKETEAMAPTATKHELRKQKRELRIAEAMVELCKGDGEEMDVILSGDSFDVVSLEEAFNHAAYSVCHQRDFHRRSGTALADAFSQEQRRLLAYLLWLPVLADHKRKRMKMATRFLH